MTAELDKRRNHDEYNGTVSDPRLVKQLGSIKENTPNEMAHAEQAIDRHAHSPQDHDLLSEMVFGRAKKRWINRLIREQQ